MKKGRKVDLSSCSFSPSQSHHCRKRKPADGATRFSAGLGVLDGQKRNYLQVFLLTDHPLSPNIVSPISRDSRRNTHILSVRLQCRLSAVFADFTPSTIRYTFDRIFTFVTDSRVCIKGRVTDHLTLETHRLHSNQFNHLETPNLKS